jgi:NAD(P)H-nitrite reductase large subunit
MPKNDHYVIIGNGPSGNRAAEVLRTHDSEARITIVSDEGFSFYYKHMLFDFLAGDKSEETLKVKPHSEYKEKNIRMRLGQKVERIDPDNRVLYFKHMEKVGYTKLILATGATHRVIPSFANFAQYFSVMTGYNDALNLKPQLESTKSVIVIGGDFISIDFAKMLSRMKKKVTFLLYSECFWPVDITKQMAEAVSSNMEKKGISTILDDYPASIKKKGKEYNLKTEKGITLNVDMIFSFMGMVPNIGFIIGSGIDTEKGVLVDEYLRTNNPDIYACGDCAQIYNPKLKDYWASVGWGNAGLQGETAAYNLLGEQRVVKPMPKKIFEVEGIRVNTSWWKELE